MQTMALLEKALHLSVKAHSGQRDRVGEPYIFHPIRVMIRCSSPSAKIVALLHDTVEDTDVTFDQLETEGFPEEIVAAVRLVTREENESYDAYINGLMHDPIAVEVKRADLFDNADVQRFQKIGPREVEKLRKYHRALRRLKECGKKGPPTRD